jgi:acetyl-CoA synthetase
VIGGAACITESQDIEDNMTAADSFVAARDFLQLHRMDYATAYADFRSPVLDTFNWALDFFDDQARDNHGTALWLVEDGLPDVKVSFATMSRRSNQVANQLRHWGVRRGDSVLLMLPNELALWETMLACMKLGAVMIPTTMLLSTDDLRDRF